ncbi:putative transmembrane protein [Diplonema papillatum]|nr:putative transmembrane protein [Diplonema papillatum]
MGNPAAGWVRSTRRAFAYATAAACLGTLLTVYLAELSTDKDDGGRLQPRAAPPQPDAKEFPPPKAARPPPAAAAHGMNASAGAAPYMGGGSPAGLAGCSVLKSCAGCLASEPCVWCANTHAGDVRRAAGFCVAAAGAEERACPDVESRACPAVLLHPNGQLPTNFRVIHVGIQKGGPEALVQMHLALLFWGFRTTLDTRRNKQGGQIKSFFRSSYRRELEGAPDLRWFDSYDGWLASGMAEDVFIETETWPCKNDMPYHRGMGRQVQWHLTVWPKKAREACTVAAHTHFIAKEYMAVSVRSVMYPYISPHIHELSDKNDRSPLKKEDLVLYDADSGLTDKDFAQSPTRFRAVMAKGLKPEHLYDLYARAKVCIDLRLPGAERFVYESSLFGCCVVVDDDQNGSDEVDLPIPGRFRVPAGDKAALNDRIQEVLKRHGEVTREFAPLRTFVQSQRVTFLRQVRRYFSDNVHIVTAVPAPSFAQSGSAAPRVGDVVLFVLAHVLSLPFATLDVILCPAAHASLLSHPTVALLRSLTLLASVKFTSLAPTHASCTSAAPASNLGSEASAREILQTYQPPVSAMQYVLAYASVTGFPVDQDLISVLATQAVSANASAVSLGDNDSAVFSLASRWPAVRSCTSWGASCPGTVGTSPMYRRVLQGGPLVGFTHSRTAAGSFPKSFLCQHPVYANASVQRFLPEIARCTFRL